MTKEREDTDDGELVRKVEHFSQVGTINQKQGQLLKALDAYRNAYHCVMSLGKSGYMQRACAFNLGAALISSKKISEGLHYMQQAVPPEGQQDGKSNGDLYFNFGLAYKGLKKSKESEYFFKRALEDYRQEGSNIKMASSTIQLLEKISFKKGHYRDAEDWLKQLIEIYSKLEQSEQLLIAKMERANICLKTGRGDIVEEIANECWEVAKKLDPTENVVRIYNEIALVFCQLEKYDKAWQCYKSASAISVSPNLEALLQQNMGALCNQMNKFEESIMYHKNALQKHYELNNRRIQCHCLINLGYAYSQLNKIDEAGDHFLEALQASRDCGDKKSEWQSLESLGAVAYHEGSPKKAKEYYKQALTVFLGSSEAGDRNIQDRILGKLTNILKLQIEKSASSSPDITEVRRPPRRNSSVIDSKQSASEQSPAIPERKKKKRLLKAKKSMSAHKFQKVAIGLDTADEKMSQESMSDSDDTSDKKIKPKIDLEMNADDNDQVREIGIGDKAKLRKVMADLIKSNYESERELDSNSVTYDEMESSDSETEKETKLKSHDDKKMDVDKEDDDSAEDDKKRLRKVMEKLIESQYETERELDSSSTSYEFNTSDSDTEKETLKNLRTYEVPVNPKESPNKSETSVYDTIPGTFKKLSGYNYLKDETLEGSGDPGPSQRVKKSTDDEKSEVNIEDMTKAERDIYLHSKHVEMVKKKQEEQDKEKTEDVTNEKSKSCILICEAHILLVFFRSKTRYYKKMILSS
ncbi:hypothetical protein Btru_003536 [Bulinus truncatus]|nr:hypothetical protein Btru_003536 [Bulinus truncatus]